MGIYRNSRQQTIEQFFEGTGVQVEDYSPGQLLVLLTERMDGREYDLVIVMESGKLKIQRSAR